MQCYTRNLIYLSTKKLCMAMWEKDKTKHSMKITILTNTDLTQVVQQQQHQQEQITLE